MIVIDIFYFSSLLVYMALLAIVLIIGILSMPEKKPSHFLECLGYGILLLCFYASLDSLRRVEVVPLYQFIIMFVFSLFGVARAFDIGQTSRRMRNDYKRNHNNNEPEAPTA